MEQMAMPIDFANEARHAFEAASKPTRDDATPVLSFVSHGFKVTWFKEHGAKSWLALLKPHTNIADHFALRLEYFLIGHGFKTDFQNRTLRVNPPEEIAYRVDERIRFVSSSAPMMKAVCAAWASQNRISVVPIEMARAGDGHRESSTGELYDLLSSALWRRDVFDDSEPVTEATEFFGREGVVQQLVTKTYLGQLSAVFGLRKIGKTSLLRRVEALLDGDRPTFNAPVFIQCNATRIKAGRWHVILADMIEAWTSAINSRAESEGLNTRARPDKLSALLAPGRPTASESAIADAFQKDVGKLLKAAHSIIGNLEGLHVRLVAIFDEADELYPHRVGAGYWDRDYFLLWNCLQTVKRGSSDPRELVYILGGVNPAGVEAGQLCGQPNPLFELSKLYLRPLPQNESQDLLTGLGDRVGLTFELHACRAAFEITGGHPWLLRKLGSKVHQSQISRTSTIIVSENMVREVFALSRRSFYQHVDWILSHLREVSPDEYNLLCDIANGKDLALTEWADEHFRDSFAEHLAQYGILRFDDGRPSITMELVEAALTQSFAPTFPDQKKRLREAGDTLEHLIRARLLADLPTGRTKEEMLTAVVEAIPKEAANRPKNRQQLRELGETAGLPAILDALNWGDYVLILTNEKFTIAWSGPALTPFERRRALTEAVEIINLARHNNDSELKARIKNAGFQTLWSTVGRALESLTS